ncbi:MAG TPA: hypothetical protein VMG40_07355 [Bryobacteraceae bacterium]|nr:hypothetical protein [Bryobacteraceae bacterium]
MLLKRETVTKLASLSAIGVSAVVMGESTAIAGVISSGLINESVGFNGSASHFSVTLGTLGKFNFQRTQRNVGSTGNAKIRRIYGTGVSGGLKFAAVSGHMQIFGASATWGERSGSGTKEALGKRFFGLNTFSHSTSGGNPAFTDKYALFHFGPSAGDYGWVELSLQLANAGGSSGANGPNVTIVSYAYDNDGVILAAGSETESPEPSTFELSGLAALALGAAGVRRWRAVRAKPRE